MGQRLLILMGFVACMSMATAFDPGFQRIQIDGSRSTSVLAVLMGDSRQLLANHFFLKADAYFHYGTYPSIFDQPRTEESHMSAHAAEHADEHEDHDGHGHAGDTEPRKPDDFLARFGSHFVLNADKHLEGGDEREILPWLKLSAELDPHRTVSYVTASYWLRKKLNKPVEAEEFLRLGLHNNPDSYEILFELGALYNESKQKPAVARNLWEMALNRWEKQKKEGLNPDGLVQLEILGQLAKSEGESGHYDKAIAWLEKLKSVSPDPPAIERLIQMVKAKSQK